MKRFSFVTVLFLFFSSSLSAITLNFDGTPGYYPFPSAGDAITYDAGTGTLTTTYSEVWDGSPNPFVGLLDITASVDNAGNLLGGSVQWAGGDADLGIAPGTLLYQADITGMSVDYDDTVDPFLGIDFTFNTTFVHTAMSLGDQVGIRIFAGPPFEGATANSAFASSFTGFYFYTHAVMGDLTRSVPEPAPLALIALGMLLLVPVVKLRGRKKFIVNPAK